MDINNMKKIVCENYEELCQVAADQYTEQLKKKPDSVLGLATGSTPIGLYNEMIRRSQEGKIDFSKARTFNLDEYYPIKASHPQSYKSFMDEHLFSKVKFASTRIMNGEAADPHIECREYDKEIEAAGGFDLLLLGIGVNGHIAFIEPDSSYPLGSYLVDLAEETIVANSRFFEDKAEQPPTAMSMGLKPIFNAKRIIMLVTGANKADIIRKLFDGNLHTDIPACFLHLHPDVTIILDKAANGE